jgi:hypothetical protein
MVDRTKFHDAMGRRVTIGLFKEFERPDMKFRPFCSLAEWKEVFLNKRDPSEYAAAMELVGDWPHWLEIRNHPLIKKHVDQWVEELHVKLKSEAIGRLVEHAMSPGGTAAAKWLAEKGYNEKKSAGRPSTKEEIAAPSPVDDDIARLGLRVVGGK